VEEGVMENLVENLKAAIIKVVKEKNHLKSAELKSNGNKLI
jgi:hypothetical protein